MKLEDSARQQIDQLLEAAGWSVRDKDKVNLGAGLDFATEQDCENLLGGQLVHQLS